MREFSRGTCPVCKDELAYRQAKDLADGCFVLFTFCLHCKRWARIIGRDRFPFRDPAGEQYDMLSAIPSPISFRDHHWVGC
jgi:hypothetical protein